jgi:phosphopantetheine adenylyltransferase
MKEKEIEVMADEISDEIVRAFTDKFNTRLNYLEKFIKRQQDSINKLISIQKATVAKIESLKTELDMVERSFRDETSKIDEGNEESGEKTEEEEGEEE